MASEPTKPNILLQLAAEGIAPIVAGCANILTASPAGPRTRATAAEPETAIDLFGRGIVEKWREWFAIASPEERAAAPAELAALSPAAVREQARQLLAERVPDADPRDLSTALEYLCSIPTSMSRAMVIDLAGQRSVPSTVSWDEAHTLLQLLPQDIPPYASGSELPGTPYRLEELLGTGGFGAVYRATSPTLQHLPLAIKFCLDRSLLPALSLERTNLERLMRAAGERGSHHVVKLYGYDLDHPTPYLVYEYVPGGDLTGYVARHRTESKGPMSPDKILEAVTQLAEGLAFAHRVGLVHRDVKPANVLVHDSVLKLADFGLGGVAVRRAVERSRIGATTIDYLTLAERASLFRGAGTPLYMSPEQRRGANPDPRHDLYSLGVLWFQLLAGDVTRELHPGWAKELSVRFKVPAGHIHLIERCVGWLEERPKDASELLNLLRDRPPEPPPLPVARIAPEPAPEITERATTETATPAVTPTAFAADAIRKERLLELLRGLQTVMGSRWPDWRIIGLIGVGLFVIVFLITASAMAVQHNTQYTSGVAVTKSTYTTGEAVAIGLAVATPVSIGVTGLLTLAIRAIRAGRARINRYHSLTALAVEFPAEVEAWGGPEQLQSPAVVAAILDQVKSPEFRVSALAAPGSAVRPASLRPSRAKPQAPPFWVAAGLALLLAGLAGVLAGVLTQTLVSPFDVREDGHVEYYETLGTKIDQPMYQVWLQRATLAATAVGFATGLTVLVAGTWVLNRKRRYLWPTLAASFLGLFVLGLPAALGTGALACQLLGPTVDQSGRTSEYRNILGERLRPREYAQEKRIIPVLTGVAGALVGLGLTAGLVMVVRWRYRAAEPTPKPVEPESVRERPWKPKRPPPARATERPPAAPTPAFTPDPLGANRMGLTVLRSRLLEYARLRKSAARTNFFLGAMTVLFIVPGSLLCMGIIGKGVDLAWLAVLLAFSVGGGILAATAVGWSWMRKRQHARRRELAAELSASYGSVFEQWGGPGFLNNSKALDAVLAELYRRDHPLG